MSFGLFYKILFWKTISSVYKYTYKIYPSSVKEKLSKKLNICPPPPPTIDKITEARVSVAEFSRLGYAVWSPAGRYDLSPLNSGTENPASGQDTLALAEFSPLTQLYPANPS